MSASEVWLKITVFIQMILGVVVLCAAAVLYFYGKEVLEGIFYII